MQSIQLGSKLGGNSDNALGSSSGLLANTVNILGVDNVSEGSGEGFFFAKAVAPAVF